MLLKTDANFDADSSLRFRITNTLYFKKHMKLLLHIFAFVLLSGVATFAQEDSVFTISGRVFEKATGKPIPAASLKIAGTKLGTYTKMGGDFLISNIPPGKHLLEIRAIGITDDFDTLLIVNNQSLVKFDINIPSQFSTETAYRDIERNKIQLHLVSGNAPCIMPGDSAFQEKYGIMYSEWGCTVPCSDECIAEYNRIIFKYLDQKYGKEWRREVRPGIIGFKEYDSLWESFKSIFKTEN